MKRRMVDPVMVGLAFVFSSCAVKAPEVRITGEKTALEKQILGTYAQIKEDVWMVASVRSSEAGEKVVISEEKKQVLEVTK